MGYDTPSVWNKINIHVGGSYGDKQATMERWAAAYNRLTPSCRLRMTGDYQQSCQGVLLRNWA